MSDIHLEQKLRSAGGRVTPQRTAIVSILHEKSGHLSAEEIHRLARRRHPRLSLATVYRTLRWMKACGLVNELRLSGESHRYEIHRDEAHQHMVCQNCGKIVEFTCDHCTDVHADLAEKHGFLITGARVRLLGYCADCRARSHKGTQTTHGSPVRKGAC
jgi:Fur family peroxide stress response transcriptional regulator